MNIEHKHALLVRFNGWSDNNGYTVTISSKRFKKHFTLKDLSDLDTNSFTKDIHQRLTKLGFNILFKCEYAQDSEIWVTDTFNMPEIFTLSFVGRRVDAIGKMCNYVVKVKAVTLDAARAKLYDNYDHILFNAIV